mgnify:CR=1 FL=1
MINLDTFCNTLKHGKTLLYPTDTIWGLGCDATNQAAVDRIYTLKNRTKEKPLIALVSGIEMLAQYVEVIPKNIASFLQNDRPTTIVYPNGKGLAKGVISANGKPLAHGPLV